MNDPKDIRVIQQLIEERRNNYDGVIVLWLAVCAGLIDRKEAKKLAKGYSINVDKYL